MNKIIKIEDYNYWDKFVSLSPQGSIFSTAKWMQLFDAPFKIYGCYKNDNLIGGMANFDSPQPLTPFQGILTVGEDKYHTNMSNQMIVARSLVDVAPKNFYNHWNFLDIRPFKWAGWKCDVRFTYVISLMSQSALWAELDKDTKNIIKREMKDGLLVKHGNLEEFDALYDYTFQRKELPRPITSEFLQKLDKAVNGRIYIAYRNGEAGAGVYIMEDTQRAYYILGASTGVGGSSFCLWKAIEDCQKPEIDLVGCNNEKIGLFKSGFGGKLTPYYGVEFTT